MKKSVYYLLTIVLVSMLSVGFTACSNDDDKEVSPIVGTWTYVERDGDYAYTEIITFKSDGTYKLIWQEDIYTGEENGTYIYDAKNSKLTIIENGASPYVYLIILSGNQMTLIGSEDGDAMTYTRQ